MSEREVQTRRHTDTKRHIGTDRKGGREGGRDRERGKLHNMLNSEGRYILFFPFRFSPSFSSLCQHLPLSSLPTIVTLLLSFPDNYYPFISFTILSSILLLLPFPSSPPFPFYFISFHSISSPFSPYFFYFISSPYLFFF